jgi:dTDP-4-dehydrorhamnose reductase
MNVLITGGNGYIAKSIYDALKDKYNITTITRQDFNLTNYAETWKFFTNKYFDVVIHTAVVGGSRLVADKSDVLDCNLQMYYNLLACKDHYNKFIHFGSGAEEHNPNGYYGFSKRVIAESIRFKQNFYNIKIYGVFDENELPTRFIKASLMNYINKQAILVHEDKKMDFFYMKDLITLVDHHIKTDASKLYHASYCSYLQSYSLVDIANMINELSDYKVGILVGQKQIKDYISSYNAGYSLDYVGLKKGIIEVYNKLKI